MLDTILKIIDTDIAKREQQLADTPELPEGHDEYHFRLAVRSRWSAGILQLKQTRHKIIDEFYREATKVKIKYGGDE